ncbi:uroporphyrinogen decarboxylase family protein [Candidatus Leptofilum sp.]|uniref:uroporphyrinogen decarboxylase family protein n=1 Tax=Candidatus Leptofilum sp. TaxID=3241576 RepID=UPI003B59DFC3
MTPKERVLMAVAHQEPDRVPLALWGSWYGVTDKLYFNILDSLGWEAVAPFRPGKFHSVNYYDDRLLEQLHIDVRHVDPGTISAYSKVRAEGTDALGIKWDTSGLYRTACEHPVEHFTVEQIMEFPMPNADELIDQDQILERVKTIKSLGEEYAVVGRAVASYGFFEMSQSMRKHEQLFIDLALAPDIVFALLERLYDFYAAMIVRFLDIAGASIDILELPGDDFAGNSGPIISTKMFDKFYKQAYARIIHLVKEHSPHIKVIYHSDGAMTAFLSRLIEIGADIFHSAEPLPAWNLGEMKTQYGDHITFMGGIDIKDALPGSKQEVIAEVKNRLAEMGSGGGYILAPSNHVQWDVPPENVFTLYESARKYGRYPLQLDKG